MEYINVRQLFHNFNEAVAKLPVTVTKYGKPFLIIDKVPEEVSFKSDKPFPMAPEISKKISEEHICSWDKAFKCTSPGTVKKGKRWFCAPHAL